MEVLVWFLTIFGLVGIPTILAASFPYEWLEYACIIVNAFLVFIITQQLLEIVISLFSRPVRSFTSSVFKTITIIIPAYLPNEKDIIISTLDSYANISYNGGGAGSTFNVILAYNTPTDMPEAEKLLTNYQTKNSGWLSLYKVVGSRTKAQNINYVLDNAPGINDIVGIFDADHHPYADTLYRANYWLTDQNYDFVQGRCKVRPNKSVLSNLVSMNFDLMYCVQHQFRKVLFDVGIFGGSDGYWKKDVLKTLKFDPTKLTEDIDCTVRAIGLGYKGTYDKMMVSSEDAPPSLTSLFHQRVRWAQGWMEVSLAHFTTYFSAPNYNAWQRFYLVNLFVIRELICHIVLLCLPFMIAKMIWLNGFSPDLFGGLTLLYALTTYPLMVIAGIVSSYELYHKDLWLIPVSVLASIVWIYFEQLIMMRARVRWLLRQNNWMVTRRS